jgi:Ca2+-binding RTX toxin-like protein
MTFSGTIAAINAALNGLVYRGNLNYEGSDTLSVSTSDLGATGTGNVLTDNDSVAITLADDGYITGSNGDDVMTGTPNPDFFRLEQGGNDDVTGLASNDVFFFGAALTSADKVDGDGGIDQMGLQGDYSGANALTLGTGVLSIESLAILPGSDTRFGAPGTDLFSYDITTVDENVAAGVRMVIDANRLQAGENFTFDGSAETDGSFFIYGAGGVDNLTGGAQNDIFLFGELGQFGANDVVDGGPGGLDQLGLRGDYTIAFGATQLINIVSFALVSAHDTRFASLGENFDYDLTMDDGNVAAGVQLTVDGANLRASESLTFDGGAELDGTFRVFGGAGSDVIMGGEGADIIVGRGGADLVGGCNGADTFRYDAISESSAAAPDMIMDFEHAIDNIDLRLIDANTLLGGNQAFHSIGSGAFSGAGAASAGQLRFEDVGSNWLVEGDVNGDGVADLVLQVTMFGPDTLTASDFQF